MIGKRKNNFGSIAARKLGGLLRGVSSSIRRRLGGPTFGDDNPADFVVLSLKENLNIDLTHPVPAEILINHLTCLRQDHWIKVGGFVILTGQIELLVTPVDQRLLDDILKNFIACTTEQINFSLKRAGEVWSPSIQRHVVKNRDELQKYLKHIRRQPAEKHLVSNPSRWPWSTFHRSLEHLYDRDFFSLSR